MPAFWSTGWHLVPTFPDEDPRPHMPNECMPVKSLLKASDIYYEALVELACTKR